MHCRTPRRSRSIQRPVLPLFAVQTITLKLTKHPFFKPRLWSPRNIRCCASRALPFTRGNSAKDSAGCQTTLFRYREEDNFSLCSMKASRLFDLRNSWELDNNFIPKFRLLEIGPTKIQRSVNGNYSCSILRDPGSPANK